MFPIGMHEMLAEGALNFPTAPVPSGAMKWKGAFLSVVICQAILCFFRFAIDDPWGAVTDGVLLVVAYFAIFDMSIMYILWYMVLSAMVFAFDIIFLVVRAAELQKRFFSRHHHPVENFTSFLVVLAPVLAFAGCCVAWKMYSYYEPLDDLEATAAYYDAETGLRNEHDYGSAACARQRQERARPALTPFSGPAFRLD